MSKESTFREQNEKVSRYSIIFYILIGIVFSVLTAMTYDYLGGIRVIITAGMSIEQVGSLIFFAFMSVIGLYFSIRNFRKLGITVKRKRIIGILVVVLILFGLIFFVKHRYFEASDKVIDSSDNVKLVLVEDTISKESLEMCILNTLPHKIYYTKDHSLEAYRFGEWFKVPSTRYQVTTAMFWQIPIENQESFQYSWKGRYGEIGSGKYRVIVKLYQDSACSDEKNAIYVASEFIID